MRSKKPPRSRQKNTRKVSKRSGYPATNRSNRKPTSPPPPTNSAPKQSDQTTLLAENISGDWLYGRHTVCAALKNPNRVFHQVLCTRQGAEWLMERGLRDALVNHKVVEVLASELDEFLPRGSVHQGVAAAVAPLNSPSLEDILEASATSKTLLVLDQISDPQNIGAIFRIAAAFNVFAIIVQDRRTPPLAGALAKAAVGCVEVIPCVPVVNIARSITTLKEAGYHCTGLTGEASVQLPYLKEIEKVALVLGAEGSGLRSLVAKTCDSLVTIPISNRVESLNVSTAAAIALYEISNSRDE